MEKLLAGDSGGKADSDLFGEFVEEWQGILQLTKDEQGQDYSFTPENPSASRA